MRICFVGGASAIGASCLAIELAGSWIVIDAGIRQGTGDPLPDLSLLEDKPVRAILVTHAHADHIGALPILSQAFPDAAIYASRATCVLMDVMLADSLSIMARRALEELEFPLYTPKQVEALLNRLRPLPLFEDLTLPELAGVTLHLTPAGHIPGAVSVALWAKDGSVIVSGDISAVPQRLVGAAVVPPLTRPHLLVLESTYGARLHPNRQAEERRLLQQVTEGIAGGGHVLIPCFALGRGQEVLLLLLDAQQRGWIPPFPIVVDGLVRRICAALTQIPEALSSVLIRQIRQGYAPFTSQTVRVVQDAHERESILSGEASCIVTSSGMLTGGPSAWYASRLLGDSNASILLTGYQDDEGVGSRLIEVLEGKRRSLVIGGHEIEVRCHLNTYSLSAHADGGELASYAAYTHSRAIALVHGDATARQSLHDHLRIGAELPVPILLPEDGDAFELVDGQMRKTIVSARRIAPPPPGAGEPLLSAREVALRKTIQSLLPAQVQVMHLVCSPGDQQVKAILKGGCQLQELLAVQDRFIRQTGYHLLIEPYRRASR